MDFTCPMCKKVVETLSGDWPFVRSQVILHFARCEASLDLNLGEVPLRLIASRITDDLLASPDPTLSPK